MGQHFIVHPENPQRRLLKQAADIIQQGGVVIYPTDSAYAIGCHLGDKNAMERVRRIRQLDKHHNFTLVCRDLSELGTYAVVDNRTFRLLKSHTPGPYTFILRATKEVPRRLSHPQRKTIGLRIPDCNVTQGLLECLNEPLMSCSLRGPDNSKPLVDPDEIYEHFHKQIDLMIDGGYCGDDLTSVIDMHEDEVNILRVGKGEVDSF